MRFALSIELQGLLSLRSRRFQRQPTASSGLPIFETAGVTPVDAPMMNESCCFANGLNEYTSARWAPDGSLWAAFAAYRDDGDLQAVLGRLVPVR